MGNFPKAEVEFMCISPGDPRLSPPPTQTTTKINLGHYWSEHQQGFTMFGLS
jgi:hypothetical protein